jgi:hypothetical protein
MWYISKHYNLRKKERNIRLKTESFLLKTETKNSWKQVRLLNYQLTIWDSINWFLNNLTFNKQYQMIGLRRIMSVTAQFNTEYVSYIDYIAGCRIWSFHSSGYDAV